MAYKTAVVFTAKSIERILREGGTSSWRLDRNHARQCIYAICTRNAHNPDVEGLESHKSAFLVGKVKDVVPAPDVHDRYLIQFSEYARVDIPDVWQGDRNPVKYATLEELGIDPSTLTWVPMPEPDSPPDRYSRTMLRSQDAPEFEQRNAALPPQKNILHRDDVPLTMAEAKKGLALTFGVSPDSIEITIRG